VYPDFPTARLATPCFSDVPNCKRYPQSNWL
jgi:hypothetical protein